MHLVVVSLRHADYVGALQLVVHLAGPKKSIIQIDMVANVLDMP
jgi:hypothetical protein